MANIFRTTSRTGRPMIINVLLPGDRYGLNDCLVWGEDAGRARLQRRLHAHARQLQLAPRRRRASRAGRGVFSPTSKFSREREPARASSPRVPASTTPRRPVRRR